MIDHKVPAATTIVRNVQRESLITIFLALTAFILVLTSVAAFIYITRKERILRKCHLLSVLIILFIELSVLIAVVICCITQSKSNLGQILTAFLILLSLLALMMMIYFLLEDIIKEKIEPYPRETSFKSYETNEVKSISRHASPIPINADDTAIPIYSPPAFTPFPRLPTPPPPTNSSPSRDFMTPSPGKTLSPSPILQEIFDCPKISHYIVDLEQVRRDLLAAMDERTISALENAIQQVKDHQYTQQLKYEFERALELLSRLMKIEHMKIRVLRLNQTTIAELHSYTKPPEEVYRVMRATFLLLGHSNKEIQEWTQIQNLLGRLGKESVRRRCYELSPLNIVMDKAHEAKDILRNYDLIRVSEISLGLAAFFSWAVTMIEEREKLIESQGTIIR